jgi:hypothetical protein
MKNDGLYRLTFKTHPTPGVKAEITVTSISDEQNEQAMQLLEQAPQFLKDLRMLVDAYSRVPKRMPVSLDLHDAFDHVKCRLEEIL